MFRRHFPSQKGPSREILIQPQDLFRLIQNGHLKWMNETDDPDPRSLVNLFETIMEQYEALFGAVQNQS